MPCSGASSPPQTPPDTCTGLVVAHDRRGRGLGARLLDWAAAHIAERGRPWLRLDCGTVNAPLRAFYERERFAHVRDVEVDVSGYGDHKIWRASLYQRPAGADGVSRTSTTSSSPSA